MRKRRRGTKPVRNILLFAAVIAVIAALFIVNNFNGSLSDAGLLKIIYIDVGQGDSELIRSPEGSFMLIDTSEADQYDRLAGYLSQNKVKNLDCVIFTHPHSDHMGGAAKIVKNYSIGTLIMPGAVNTTAGFDSLLSAIESKGLSVARPKPGTEYDFGGASFTVLAPNSDSYAELNDYSVVIRLTYGEKAFMFTGDAQSVSEGEMLQLAQKDGLDLSCDILKVGHHGSTTSTGETFLKAVSPAFAVISCGAGNPYGHPNAATLNTLKKYGVKVYRTDLNGSVTATSDGKTLKISTAK